MEDWIADWLVRLEEVQHDLPSCWLVELYIEMESFKLILVFVFFVFVNLNRNVRLCCLASCLYLFILCSLTNAV